MIDYSGSTPPKRSFLGLLGIFLASLGCLMVICIGVSSYFLIRILYEQISQSATPTQVSTTSPTLTTPPVILSPTASTDLDGADETLKTLTKVQIPVNDLRELAHRLGQKPLVSPTLAVPPKAYELNDKEEFWVVNSDTDQYKKVKADLAYITEHLYFWIEEGVQYNLGDLKKLCETFETQIYPTNREFFGSEWSPGIDNDVHLYVLLNRQMGSHAAGYFSSSDSIPSAAFPYSNQHEMFMMSTTSKANLADDYYLTILAHEFQHMIHWYRDRNEEGWVNEGFSELAAFLNGYGVGNHDTVFTVNPDLQLNDWPNDENKTMPHYGASFLFFNYFLNRFGKEVTQALVSEPENGMVSIDKVLADFSLRDPITSQSINATDVFVDWTLANYLKDSSVGDGRYTYDNYKKAPTVQDTETIRSCPTNDLKRTVNQFGADYIRIICKGSYTLSFQGNREVGVLPTDAHSGKYAFWSNKGDESDITLSKTFDFTTIKDRITLSYWTWYDLEEHYDFVYLVASTDGGQTWQILQTPSSTNDNISGNNYGWGYNQKSKSWIQERVDLSQYAGKKVVLRFEYVTDAAVNGEGFMLDDIEIPQIGYQTDFETDIDGWEANGFVRIQNRIPQTYRLTLIQSGKPRSVQYLQVKPDQTFTMPLKLESDVILVVSGTTPYTRLPANYTFSIK